MKKRYIHLGLTVASIMTAIFYLTACGGGGSSSDGTTPNNTTPSTNNETNSPTALPSDINGLLTFERYKTFGFEGPKGIFELKLKNGNVISKRMITAEGKGSYPYAHQGGKIIFAEPCGASPAVWFKYYKKNGLISAPVTPCSNALKFDFYTSFIRVGKLSPDESKIAIHLYHLGSLADDMIVVFDTSTKKEIKRFLHYGNPAWHPSGSLLMTPLGIQTQDKGIYITDNQLNNLRRIDHQEIQIDILHPDISPSGKQVVFSMNQHLWLMDIDGNNLHELLVEDANLLYPSWSPDEKYIAYMSYDADGDEAAKKISFLNLANKKSYILDTDTVLPPEVDGGHSYIAPAGPLSWIE